MQEISAPRTNQRIYYCPSGRTADLRCFSFTRPASVFVFFITHIHANCWRLGTIRHEEGGCGVQVYGYRVSLT